MRDLSLHIMDLIENSLRAGATHVRVEVEQQPDQNLMRVSVEDNGPGLPVASEQAADPFFTTKGGKRVGLGLSLFQAMAERAEGTLTLERSDLGGLAARAVMQLNHVDRTPLGELADTISMFCCAHPDVRFTTKLVVGDSERIVDTVEHAQHMCPADRSPVALAQSVAEAIRRASAELRVRP